MWFESGFAEVKCNTTLNSCELFTSILSNTPMLKFHYSKAWQTYFHSKRLYFQFHTSKYHTKYNIVKSNAAAPRLSLQKEGGTKFKKIFFFLKLTALTFGLRHHYNHLMSSNILPNTLHFLIHPNYKRRWHLYRIQTRIFVLPFAIFRPLIRHKLEFLDLFQKMYRFISYR